MTASLPNRSSDDAEGTRSSSGALDREEIFRRVEALLPEIRERGSEFEDARHIPLDIVAKLREAGCFRICVPSALGGAELAMRDRLNVLSVLAQADASVGWTVAIAADSVLIALRASRQAVEEIFLDDPDTVLAGAAAPQGTAVKVDGGYRVSGRWAWASGSLHAQWLTANCIVLEDGRPVRVPGQEGPPMMRMAIIPKQNAQVIDTWNVVGLCATGSNDFIVDDLFVPDSHILDFFSGEPCADSPVYRSFHAQAALILAALAIGIARGALADILAITQARKQRMFTASDMSNSEIVQLRLGNAHSTLEAATMAMHAKGEEYAALASTLPAGPEQLRHPLVLTTCAIATWVVGQAAEVVEMAYDAGGGSSVWRKSTLQRRLRDIKTLTSHIHISESGVVNLGKGMIEGAVKPLWSPADQI